MGNSSSRSEITKKELYDYMELTYLTKSEIIHAFCRFKDVSPDQLNFDKSARIPFPTIKNIPELQSNPFVDRIGRVFSSEDDGSWSFEDFLDMVSVFNEKTPVKKKSEYAFRIYDYDGDGFLSHSDLSNLITALVGSNTLNSREVSELALKILKEADIDNDGMLSADEFQHCLTNIPQFSSSFTLRI